MQAVAVFRTCKQDQEHITYHIKELPRSYKGFGRPQVLLGSSLFYDTMDKQALIEKIQTLGGLTNDEKSDLLELLRAHKKYGLVWEDKPEDVEERLRDELPVLTEVKERALISDAPDAPNHILIEGDNLEALTALSYTHEGKVDVIYIDPPYNTGKEDFVYNDKFVDSEDVYRHSKWLSFMSRRLRIARRLLSKEGVVFISIDDNEQAQLKLLCDEIFGHQNFVGTYFWKRTSTPPALSYKIRRKLEFVLCYQNSDIAQRTFVQGYVDGGDAPLLNSGNPLGILEFPANTVHFNLPDGLYTNKVSYKIQLLNNIHVVDGVNQNSFKAQGNFKWSQKNLIKEISEGTYFLIKSKQFSPRFQKSTKATKVPSNIIDEEVFVGTNEDAQKEILNLGLNFDYAKPTSLIGYVTKMPFWYNDSITILDFFAGSGTTLHATMQLNAEDGGHRKCILVTNNENGICENVTYERNKRVIQGYITPKGENVPGLTANTLRYYKTDFISRDRTQRNMHALVEAATDLLCIKEDLYEEQTHFGQYKTHPKVLRYFAQGNKRMLVLYRDEYTEEVAAEVERIDLPQGEKIKVFIFSPSRYAYDDMFQDVADKVELVALPAAIYDAYKEVLPKRREKLLELQTDHNEANEEGGEQ